MRLFVSARRLQTDFIPVKIACVHKLQIIYSKVSNFWVYTLRSDMFVGREKELKHLNSAFHSGKKELGVIYGRRRIGKTKLIDHFVQDKPHLFYQAKEDSSYGNLRSFSYELNRLMSLPHDFVYSSWQAALDALSHHFQNQRFVLCIDEYPFITQQDPSFSSIIEEYFDHASDNVGGGGSGLRGFLLKKRNSKHEISFI